MPTDFIHPGVTGRIVAAAVSEFARHKNAHYI